MCAVLAAMGTWGYGTREGDTEELKLSLPTPAPLSTAFLTFMGHTIALSSVGRTGTEITVKEERVRPGYLLRRHWANHSIEVSFPTAAL